MIVYPDTVPAKPQKVRKISGYANASGSCVTSDGVLLKCGEPVSDHEDETPYGV